MADTKSTHTFSSTQNFQGKEPTGQPVTTEEFLKTRRFESAPAMVNVGFGLTLNLGNFESARIDVGIEIPCYPSEAEEAYNYAHDWVEKKINAEVARVRSRS